MLKRASAVREEAQWLEAEGLQKIESAVVGSEAEDFYGLLRGAASHTSISSILPPPKKCHPAPTATISQSPPQKSEKVTSKVSVPVTEGEEQTPEASAATVMKSKLALEAPL